MRTRGRPPLRGALSVALSVGLLAGCAQLPAVTAPAGSDREPLVVQPVQANRIVEAAGTVLAAAADPATVDLTALATRVSGPELDLRTAAHTIAVAGATPPPSGGADEFSALTSILPRQEAFPRWFATVTDAGADQSPSLVVFRSPSAREPYTVWATPSLLPGASLPTLAAPAGGVAAVAAGETTNLPLSPQAAAEHYADVLTHGGDSRYAPEFADDAYRGEVANAARTESAALDAAGGSFTQERSVLPDGVLGVRTRDGGALVVAAFSWSTTSAGPADGRSGTLEPALAALAGTKDALSATVVHREVVVLRLPPGQGQALALAAESGPVSVTVR